MQNDCYPESPPDWPKVPLSVLAELNPRYSVRKGVDYPFIEMAAVGENFGGILSMERRRLEGSGLARYRVNDTLFAKISPCPENGKVAFVGALPADVGIGSTEFIVLSPREGTVPRFLYHLACSHPLRGRAVARMEGSTGRQRVPVDAFDRRLLVPKPTVAEQAAIACVLDTVDAAIERSRELAYSVEKLRRGLMQELLPPWIGFKRLQSVTLPKDVECIELAKDVCDVRNGSTPARAEGRYWRNGSIAWLPTGKVHERVIRTADEFVTESALRECSITILPRGTVLVGMIGQGRTRGMAAYLDMEACINQNFGAFVPHAGVDGKWLFHYFDYHYSRLREMGGGTNQGALNCFLLKRLRLPLPSMEKQVEVAAILDSVESLGEAALAKTRRLGELKQSLMHDLLSGAMRVNPATLQEHEA